MSVSPPGIGHGRDGRITGTYSVPCYRVALAELPEDLRIYSSAASSHGRGVSVLMVVAICGALLVATGSVLAVRR